MNRAPWILGISCSHNGAVCLLHGEELVVALQEERVSRVKRHVVSGSRHSAALIRCLTYAGIRAADLDLIVLSVAGPMGLPEHDLRRNPDLREALPRVPTLAVSHHLAHAASAFALSGFRDAAVLVVDGVGSPAVDLPEEERRAIISGPADGWESISLYAASPGGLTPIAKQVVALDTWIGTSKPGMPTFRTLGGLFAASARQIFGDSMEAGKVMGLAPYGRPVHPVDDILTAERGRITFHDTVPGRFLHEDRWPQHQTEYEDLSASVQAALEVALLDVASALRRECGSLNLCYAGGVALNSVANERIVSESGFEDAFIVPAAEDSGAAIGAAYHGLWHLTGRYGGRRLLQDAVGPRYSDAEISEAIERAPAIELIPSDDVLGEAADRLCAGEIVGWFQGQSELGPRALGQRSILCDPRRPDAKEIINRRVKHREAFRPFAPAILRDEVANWFELDGTFVDSPFMLRVCAFKKDRQALAPAVVHVDGTGRVQTVTREANGPFYELISRFHAKTGVPILLNTSFNTMGEPIVETPGDALFALMNSDLDCCVLGPHLVRARSRGRFQSMTGMLGRISQLKAEWQAGSRNEHATVAVTDAIDRTTAEGIAAYRAEVRAALGWLPADLEAPTVRHLLEEVLVRPGAMSSLHPAAQQHLMTAGFIYCAMTKHPRKEQDWTALAAAVVRAAERELNAKLVDPFIRWLDDQPVRPVRTAQLVATARDRDPAGLPTLSLAGSLRLADGDTLLKLLELEADSPSSALVGLLQNLLGQMNAIARAALEREASARAEVIGIVEHFARLCFALDEIAAAAARA